MNDAHFLMTAGDFAGALRQWQTSPDTSRDYRFYYTEGGILLALGEYEAARASFGRAKAEAPSAFKSIGVEKCAVSWFLQGEASVALGMLTHHMGDVKAGRVDYGSDPFGLSSHLLSVAFLVLSGQHKDARLAIADLDALVDELSWARGAWPVPVAQFLKSDISADALINAAMKGPNGERMTGRAANRGCCVAEFYIGVQRELHGFLDSAADMFSKCAERNVAAEPVWFLARHFGKSRRTA